jgi:hypothetical protein
MKMKKIIFFVLLLGVFSLYADLLIDIEFDTDVVGETSTEPISYVSDYFNITNAGETAEYTISLNVIDIPNGWFLTWCHEDLSDVGLFEGCHHYTQPWTFTLPADAVLAADFQVNNMGGNEGMIVFEYIISGGDLTEDIILPFTFRTVNYVSNDNNDVVPNVTSLGNYPNPFNPETKITYTLTKSSNVKLDIYNILGQHVRSLVNDYKAAGNHSIVWNGKDKNNNDLSSGYYLYKLSDGLETKTNKMILLK